jgi:hypothetical protein
VRWLPVTVPHTSIMYTIAGLPGTGGVVLGGAGARFVEGSPPPD